MPSDIQPNGLLSQLVGIKAQKQAQDKLSAIEANKFILGLPEGAVSDGARAHAGDSLLNLVGQEFGGGGKGGKGGAGNPIVDAYKGLISKLVHGGGRQQQGQPQPNTDDPGAAGQPAQRPQRTNAQGAQQGSQWPTSDQRQATADKIAEANARTQAKIDAAKAVRDAQFKREQNQQAYEEAYQRNLKAYPDNPVKAREVAEEEVYNKNKSVEAKPASTGKPTKQFVLLPDGSTHLAWVTPGQPGGTLVDTGEPLPEGWKPAAPPSGADARTTYAQLLRSLHDKYPQLNNEQVASMAGDEYQKKYGVEIGKAEQSIAINQVLSGVGGGDYKPPIPGATGGDTTRPKLTPKANGAAPAPTTSGASGASGASTSGSAAARAGSQADSTNRSVYMADLLGNHKATGPERVRVINGRESFKKATGLDPVAFEALAASDKGTAKAIIDTVERQASVERVNEVLKTFGDEAVKRAQEVAKHEPDAPVLKKPIRELTSATVGNPALARFLLAYNGFQRQYSTLTAGAGGLSRAQLPVGIADKVDEILNPNATLETVIQSVDQVKIEGTKELEGFDKARGNMAKMIELSMQKGGGASGSAGGGSGVPEPAAKSGEDREYQGHTYHRDKAGEPWKLVK